MTTPIAPLVPNSPEPSDDAVDVGAEHVGLGGDAADRICSA